jgi:hypothetical protein
MQAFAFIQPIARAFQILYHPLKSPLGLLNMGASLRERLNDLLPQVLPASADKAVWGTALINLLRRKGVKDPEPTLRAYFSTMSGDPTSVIAKVDKGHGYYLRPSEATPSPKTVKSSPSLSSGPNRRADQQEEKFRSLFMRRAQQEQIFPVHIEHTRAIRQQAGINKWKYPDVVSVKWGVISEDGQLNKDMLEVRQSLGEQPFRIFSTELKIDVTPSTLRETFFQCVSNSRWAHTAQLAIATKISDAKVAEELERLGTSYDVSVISFGLTVELLDTLPSATELLKASDEKIEQYLASVKYETISSGQERDSLDWEHIQDLQTQHPDMVDFFRWIAKCLSDGHAYDRDTWEKMKPRKPLQS